MSDTINQPKPEVDQQRLVRQGGRLRQLIDGRWVAEIRHGWWIFAKWIAIDLRTPGHLWTPNSQFYEDCIGTHEDAIRGLALRGFSLPNNGVTCDQCDIGLRAKLEDKCSHCGRDLPSSAPSIGPAVPDRTRIFSLLAWLIGGWNVSKGITLGHLSCWDEHFDHDDEKLLRYLLESHEGQVTYDLREEIKKLKAKLYDLEQQNTRAEEPQETSEKC